MTQFKTESGKKTRHILGFNAFRGPNKQVGATAIEYALIAALIAVAIIGGARAVGTNIDGLFDSVATDVQTASGSSGSGS